jgi:hypothetical protein
VESPLRSLERRGLNCTSLCISSRCSHTRGQRECLLRRRARNGLKVCVSPQRPRERSTSGSNSGSWPKVAPANRGTVVVRPSEMVLEIEDDRGGTYLLRGRLTGGTYNAIESNAPTGARPVRARWTRLGPYYVGIWLEQDADNLFRFRLSPNP